MHIQATLPSSPPHFLLIHLAVTFRPLLPISSCERRTPRQAWVDPPLCTQAFPPSDRALISRLWSVLSCCLSFFFFLVVLRTARPSVPGLGTRPHSAAGCMLTRVWCRCARCHGPAGPPCFSNFLPSFPSFFLPPWCGSHSPLLSCWARLVLAPAAPGHTRSGSFSALRHQHPCTAPSRFLPLAITFLPPWCCTAGLGPGSLPLPFHPLPFPQFPLSFPFLPSLPCPGPTAAHELVLEHATWLPR